MRWSHAIIMKGRVGERMGKKNRDFDLVRIYKQVQIGKKDFLSNLLFPGYGPGLAPAPIQSVSRTWSKMGCAIISHAWQLSSTMVEQCQASLTSQDGPKRCILHLSLLLFNLGNLQSSIIQPQGGWGLLSHRKSRMGYEYLHDPPMIFFKRVPSTGVGWEQSTKRLSPSSIL